MGEGELGDEAAFEDFEGLYDEGIIVKVIRGGCVFFWGGSVGR